MQRRILGRTAITLAVLALLAACGGRQRADAGFPSEFRRSHPVGAADLRAVLDRTRAVYEPILTG